MSKYTTIFEDYLYHLPGKICLIIPCYNEKDRLDLNQFNKFTQNISFVFVNDGSTDGTGEYVNSALPNGSYYLNLQCNKGKAEAVRQGMLYVKTLPIINEIKWVGYWDADLAAPLEESFHFLIYSTLFTNVYGIWGSRIKKLGSKIERSFLRHVLGRLFSFIIKFVLKIEVHDSQCGAKIFHVSLIDQLFLEPFISKWIFDVEILLRSKNYPMVECPLLSWSDIKGSKMKIIKESIRITSDIYKIRKKYLRNIAGLHPPVPRSPDNAGPHL